MLPLSPCKKRDRKLCKKLAIVYLRHPGVPSTNLVICLDNPHKKNIVDPPILPLSGLAKPTAVLENGGKGSLIYNQGGGGGGAVNGGAVFGEYWGEEGRYWGEDFIAKIVSKNTLSSRFYVFSLLLVL